MPKSRRNKIVNLTKTGKKNVGRKFKSDLMEKVQDAADSHKHCYVIAVHNMRNTSLQALREELKASTRFFFGKNRVVARALAGDGSREQERMPGIQKITRKLKGNRKGNRALCFSNLDLDAIQKAFDAHETPYFAKGGVVATRTVSLPEGKVLKRIEPVDINELSEVELGPSFLPAAADESMPFPNNMETQLRGLGMPTLLKAGTILLMKPYTICEEGQALTPNQAQLLKHFQLMMARFKVVALAHYTNGELTELVPDEEDEEEGGADDNVEMDDDEEDEDADGEDADGEAGDEMDD